MYETRQEWDIISELSPNENISEIQNVFEELAQYGLTYFQWSSFSQPLIRKGARERLLIAYPAYETASLKERRTWSREFKKNEPNWFFIEAFGYQFIRSEGETFLEIAHSLLEKVKKMHSCKKHQWAYTHQNGHKTCSLCRYFEACTVEEALLHYKKGSVDINEFETLQFDHEKPLCSCGSHQTIYLQKSYLPERSEMCKSCHTFLPDGEGLTNEQIIGEDFIFFKDVSTTREDFEPFFTNWLSLLFDHYTYAEKTKEPFEQWVQPYIDIAMNLSHIYLQQDSRSYFIDALILHSFTHQNKKYQIAYNLKLVDTGTNIVSKTESFEKGVQGIIACLEDE